MRKVKWTKAKGSKAERELFHMLWKEGWAVVRAAGSGSTPLDAPDLIAGNGKRYLAIECKAVKAKRKYFPNEELGQIKKFAKAFGAEPWVGVRFDNEGWYFIKVSKIPKSKGKHFCVSLDYSVKKGLTFEELVGKYRQKRL